MAKQTINSTDVLNAGRVKINENFTELYDLHNNETSEFQSRLDTTNTQSLSSVTNNLIGFAGTMDSNGGLNLLSDTGQITPLALNDIISIDLAFTGVMPIGANLYLQIFLIVDSVVFRSVTIPLVKGVGTDDYFSASWIVPVGQSFVDNGGYLYVNPVASLTIKDRYISVTRLAKG